MHALLTHDHADLDGLLDAIFAAIEDGDVERSHSRLDLFWARLAMHIRAEHLHLFPIILRALGEKRSEDDNLPSLIEGDERRL